MTVAGQRLAAIFNPHSGGGGYKRDVPLIFDALRGLGYDVEELRDRTSPATPRASRARRSPPGSTSSAPSAATAPSTRPSTASPAATCRWPSSPPAPSTCWPWSSASRSSRRTRSSSSSPAPSRWIDLGLAGDRYFGLMAGVGMDAAVVASLHPTMKKALKEAAFAVQGLGTYLTHEDPLFRVTSEERTVEGYFAVFGNSSNYGGAFGITPLADMRDGLLDVCVLKDKSFVSTVWYWTAALINAHIKHPKVEYFRTESAHDRRRWRETRKCSSRPTEKWPASCRWSAGSCRARCASWCPDRSAPRCSDEEDAPHDPAHHAAAGGRARRHPRGHAADPRGRRRHVPRPRGAGAAGGGRCGRRRGHRPACSIPPRLVEDALAAAPRDVLLAGRDPAADVRCDGDATCTSRSTAPAPTRSTTARGERRPSTMQDLADASLVADAADEVGVVWNIVSAADAPPNTQVLDELVACLTHTGKHIQGEVQRAEEVPFVMEILAAAADGGRWDPARPFFSIVYCPVPPLQHEPEMLGAGIALAREGVPDVRLQHGARRGDGAGDARRRRRCRPTPRSSAPSSCSSSSRPGRRLHLRRRHRRPRHARRRLRRGRAGVGADHPGHGGAGPPLRPAGDGHGLHRRRQRVSRS